MRLCHPDLEAVVESDDVDYIAVLERHGWTEAPALPDLPDVGAATVKEVLDQVGDDPDLAAAALDEERAGKARKSLITQLEQIAASGGTTPVPNDASSPGNPTEAEEPQA